MSNHRAEEEGGDSFSLRVVHTQSDIIIEKRALERTHNNNANRFRAETFRVRIKQNPTRSI
jgi:hypothetical protein|tara:strand:+ start:668 stop:850 length:183 start_codon:yes stop_codon:yes gene_type:complete